MAPSVPDGPSPNPTVAAATAAAAWQNQSVGVLQPWAAPAGQPAGGMQLAVLAPQLPAPATSKREAGSGNGATVTQPLAREAGRGKDKREKYTQQSYLIFSVNGQVWCAVSLYYMPLRPQYFFD
jgi:hypothetical protein